MRLIVRTALVAATLVYVPGLLEQFEAPKAAVVRILGLAALATAAAAWRARPRERASALDWAVLGWLAVELLATLASSSPRISLLGDTQQSEGLLTSLGLAGLYLAARGATAREARSTMIAALLAGGLAALYAVPQALGLDPTHWARVATYERAGPFMRPFGTLGHPNVLGVITAAGLGASLALSVGEPRRRWLWGALSALFAAVTAVTFSRGAWLAAAAGGGLGMALAARARGISLRRALPWLGGAAVVLAAVLLIAGFGPALLRRLAEFAHPDSGSARSRLEIWRIAWRTWRAHPWLGVGPDAFELTFPRYQTPEYWRFEWAVEPAHAHSIYLHALATRGLAGAVAGAVLAGAGLLAARRAWRRGADRAVAAAWIGAAAAMLVAGAFGALGIAGAAWLAVGAGSLAALAEAPAAEPARAAASRPRAPRPAAGRRLRAAPPRRPLLAGILVATPMAALAAAQLLASRASFEALDWAPRGPGDGDPARALRAADRGPLLAPWDDVPEYYRAQTLIRVAEAAGSPLPLDAAERAARRAIQLEPDRAIDLQCLGAVWLARARAGDPRALDQARAAFERASALAPRDALLWLQLADAEISLGHAAEAVPRIRRALALYPDAAIARAMLERALAAASRREPPAPPG